MDKDGRVLESKDTELPVDGMGPRDEDGKRIRGAEQTVTTNVPPDQPPPRQPGSEGAAGTAVGGPDALIQRDGAGASGATTESSPPTTKATKHTRSTEKPQ